jgi:hypothetical protein
VQRQRQRQARERAQPVRQQEAVACIISSSGTNERKCSEWYVRYVRNKRTGDCNSGMFENCAVLFAAGTASQRDFRWMMQRTHLHASG